MAQTTYEFIKKSPRIDGIPVKWRLPKSVMARIDDIIKARKKANPRSVSRYSRSAVARELIEPWVARCCDGAVIAVVSAEVAKGLETIGDDEALEYYSLWIPSEIQDRLVAIARQLDQKPNRVITGMIVCQLLEKELAK